MMKHTSLALVMGVILFGRLFAQDSGDLINITDQSLNGDELNKLIRKYITNVSNLIPDSTTMQNTWAICPNSSGFFGLGVNGSFTFAEQKLMSQVLKGGQGFGGNNMDLTKFPESLPYMPAMAFDLRGGLKGFDVGLTGMYFNTGVVQAESNTILGKGSAFTYVTGGVDMRYTHVFRIGRFTLPNLTLQAGYYFTYMDISFKSMSTEEIELNFRNDTYMAALQVSKMIGFSGFGLVPYGGIKMLISQTNNDFSWKTNRPVTMQGKEYPDGLGYEAAGVEGDPLMYFQLYGGLGISFLMADITAGVAYNLVTKHVGVNLSLRARFGGSM